MSNTTKTQVKNDEGTAVLGFNCPADLQGQINRYASDTESSRSFVIRLALRKFFRGPGGVPKQRKAMKN